MLGGWHWEVWMGMGEVFRRKMREHGLDGSGKARTRENDMVARVMAASFAFVSAVWPALLPPARAEDLLTVAVAQRGQWDTAITELGERSGIFKKRGIAVTILYTQRRPQAHQPGISRSMDIASRG